MKRLNIIILLLFAFMALSCDSDRDDISRSEAEVRELNVIVQQGEWVIENYTLNDLDITADFTDYIFQFEENNNLIARSVSDEVVGTWRINNDSGDEFDPFDDVDFQIFFSSTGKLGELTNNFDVISATSNEIRLDLGANANSATALLVFSRN